MKGWILYKRHKDQITDEFYEIKRFQAVGEELGIAIDVVTPGEFDLIVTRDDRKSIVLNGQSVALPDFILPRMGSGTTYFALAVLRQLERLNVLTYNNSQSIDIVKDKLFTHQILAASNLPVPKTMLAKFPIDANLIEQQFGFPVIIKTLSGSQGFGVFLSESKSNFEDLMNLINATKSEANIIIQEFIQDSRGRDLRVVTVGGRVIGCMQRIAKDNNFKANYSQGGEVKSYNITPEIEWLALETAKILGLDIAGIDFLFDGDHFKVCEANSSPGFEGLESCCDISVAKEIYNFVKLKLGLFA